MSLAKKGPRNMDVALKNLSGVFGYDKLLYYGFGYRSFVNILAETKVRVNLVALSALKCTMSKLLRIVGVRTSPQLTPHIGEKFLEYSRSLHRQLCHNHSIFYSI